MWCNLHWFCPYVNLSQTTSVESDIMRNKKQYERIKQKLKINLSHNKNFKELIHHDSRYQSRRGGGGYQQRVNVTRSTPRKMPCLPVVAGRATVRYT